MHSKVNAYKERNLLVEYHDKRKARKEEVRRRKLLGKSHQTVLVPSF